METGKNQTFKACISTRKEAVCRKTIDLGSSLPVGGSVVGGASTVVGGAYYLVFIEKYVFHLDWLLCQ